MPPAGLLLHSCVSATIIMSSHTVASLWDHCWHAARALSSPRGTLLHGLLCVALWQQDTSLGRVEASSLLLRAFFQRKRLCKQGIDQQSRHNWWGTAGGRLMIMKCLRVSRLCWAFITCFQYLTCGQTRWINLCRAPGHLALHNSRHAYLSALNNTAKPKCTVLMEGFSVQVNNARLKWELRGRS